MKVLAFILCLILLSGCSNKSSTINKDEVWGDFPKSMDSVVDFYRNNKALFLEEFVEKGDVTTQFMCAQFFDNVKVKTITDEGNNIYLVTDENNTKIRLYMVIENSVITDFLVKEGE